MYQGWFSLGGLEVGNNARAYGYSTTAACPVYWLAEDDCMALRDRMLGGPFSVETIRDAPWYDPNDPVISEDFLGAYVVSMEGLSDSTRSSTTTQRTGPGGRIGRSRDATRQVRTRMWLTAASMAGLEFGMNWLSASLSENACGAHNTSCGTASMEFYDSCPPERGFVEDFTEWELAATNLATHGTFEVAGPLVTVRENLILTPNLSTSTSNWNMSGVTTTPLSGIGRLFDVNAQVPSTNQFIQVSSGSYAPIDAGELVGMTLDISVPSDAPRAIQIRPRITIRYDDSTPTTWGNGAAYTIHPGETQRLQYSETALSSGTVQAALVPALTGTIDVGDKFIIHDGWTLEKGIAAPIPFTGTQHPKVRRNLARTPAPTVAPGPYGGYHGGGGAAASYEAVEAPWSISGRAMRYQYSVRTTETAGHGYRISQTDFTPDQITTVAYKVRSNYAGVVYTSPGGGVGTGRTIIASSGPVPIEPGQTVEVWSTFSYTSIEGDSRIAVYATAMQNDLYVDIADPIFYEGPYDPSKSYFDGSTGAPEGYATAWEGTPNASPSYMYDDDFTVEWSGAPNASTSLLRGVSVAGITQRNAYCIQSTHFLGKHGSKSLRIIPSGSTTASWAEFVLPMAALSGGTLLGTIHLKQEQTGTTHPNARRLMVQQPAQGVQAPNQPGSYGMRSTFGPVTSQNIYNLFNGASQGNGDVWWTDVGLFAGNYDGPYFNGDTEETSVTQYAWTGEPNASESTMEVRESFIRPRTDEEWGELLDQRRRFLHGVKCVSGPFVVQERESSTGAVGRLVEFTLESEVPYVFSTMRTLELPAITPTVVQDVVHNLAPYPSAELAGDPVVVSENLSTNPSLELDATGWSHLVSGSGLTATSGRVTGELAASGDASFRVVGTASGPGTSGYLAAQQTVSLPTVTGRRFSISIWAAQLIVSGLPAQGVMEARAIWRNGTTTLRTDALGPIDLNGGAVSASSISPPASATNVIVEVRANLSSWSSGDVVRLYADALAVTTP